MCMMPTRSSLVFVILLASLSLLLNSQGFSQAPPPKKAIWPGLARDGSVLLPNGWSIKEAGRQSRLGDFPVLAEIHPTEPVIAVLHAGYGEHEVITVNTNNGKIIGRPETAPGGITQDSQRHVIIGAEYCRRHLRSGQYVHCGVDPAIGRQIGMDDAGFLNRKAGETHGLQKAKFPIPGDVGVSGTGDEQDGLVSRSDKVIRGVKRGLVVVNVHAWELVEIITYRLKPDHDRQRPGLVDLYQLLAEGEH